MSSLFYISFWMVQGISMIFFNKLLLTTWGFKFPFFLTMWHMIFATVVTQVLSRTTTMLPAVKENRVSYNEYLRKFIPMSLLYAISLVLGNSAYKFISVAYIQMLKSSTPVIVLLLAICAGREKPSLVQLLITSTISLGVILATVGELKFNLLGFIIQFSAVFCECSRSLIMDLLLANKKIDSLSMLYYMAPFSSLTLAIGFLYMESAQLLEAKFTPNLLVALFLNGCLSFSLNIAVIMVINNASVIVMSACGPLKDILLVVLSVLFFRTEVSSLQVVGFGISLFGMYLFREYKSNKGACLLSIHHGCLSVFRSNSGLLSIRNGLERMPTIDEADDETDLLNTSKVSDIIGSYDVEGALDISDIMDFSSDGRDNIESNRN
jgi:drug/metabolite transporter (DMT)-like permease